MSTLRRLPDVVAFGGGHGLHTSLSALRRVSDSLTAVVTVADDGGSSGRLRNEFGCRLPRSAAMIMQAGAGPVCCSRGSPVTVPWRDTP